VKLTFLYEPAENLAGAAAFYRDQLGFDEAWRESDDTVAFWLPDRSAQVMVSTTPQPAGPMYLVDSVEEWIRDHPDIVMSIKKFDIPGGSVAGFAGPEGNTFYVFDQPDA
jgi:predicted enzyme related to lactoylglutathione lyase